jgi:hypothetical protein
MKQKQQLQQQPDRQPSTFSKFEAGHHNDNLPRKLKML